MKPQLAFIVVSYNTRELLDACIASILRCTKEVTYEIVVVDNASSDGSAALVREKYPHVALIENSENVGFGRANNLGFARSCAAYVMLLNSDAQLLEDTGAALVRFLEEHPAAGVVGPDVVLSDGLRQTKTRGMLPSTRVMLNQSFLLCRLFPRTRFFAGLYTEAEWDREMQVGWVSGVCMVLRREVYKQSGGFDAQFFMYAEDVDLCRRCASLGWETWRINAYTIRHLCGGSTKTEAQMVRNRVLQQRNFMKLLDACVGPLGRIVTRVSIVVGLLLRVVLRGIGSVVGGPSRRQAFRADCHCLADCFGLNAISPGAKDHAHRA